MATASPWEMYQQALDEIAERRQRVIAALAADGVPYALVGGQAVAMWVATKDPAAVRTTKGVDVMIRRADLSRVRRAALAARLDYCEVLGAAMLLDRYRPSILRATKLLWAGERVRATDSAPTPDVFESECLADGIRVVSLAGLVRMKLNAFRDQDRVHLRDMIDVGLVGRELAVGLPQELAGRLEELLTEMGR